eukprot:scaffold112013_cov63-Phaeocystis_antarctica.AAC.2
MEGRRAGVITSHQTNIPADSFLEVGPEGGHGGHLGHEPKVTHNCFEPELCKLVGLPIDVAARRTPSGRGRCPMAVARSQKPEDYTRTQRWRARAETSLLGRRWLV